MSQTRLGSLLESVSNTLSGMVLAMALQEFFTWYYNLPLSSGNNLTIVVTFTVVSVLRSYIWRRHFNKKLHKNKKKEG